MEKNHYFKNRGFTLLEILLVVAAIAILAGIVIIAINPAKQLADIRNAERSSDVNAILNAIYQYAIDHDGDMPEDIKTTQTEICRDDGDCTGLVDLGVLTDNEKYLISIPIDPTEASENGTGYEILKTPGNRITVIAPHAELDTEIKITR